MLIPTVVKLILYLFGLICLVWIWISLGLNVSKVKERFRLTKELKLENYTKKWLKYKWTKQYHFLLSSALKKYEVEHFSKVVTTQALVFSAFTAVVGFALKDLWFGLVISLLMVYVMPIAFLFMIHKQKQGALKNDLVESSIILLQEYEKNHRHMLFALKETVEQLQGASQVAYAKLYARMHDDRFARELAAENFSFQLGYNRGGNLATIILRACNEGANVSTLLEDLVKDISEFNKRTRDAETESRETAIIGIAPLPLLVILYFVNDNYLIPGGNVFFYQFQTELGLKSFLVSVLIGLVGIGLALMVKKPKL